MAFRTILAGVSGGDASSGVAELGCRLARRFNSHIEGFHARPDPRELALIAADGLGTPLTGNIIELATRDATETAIRARRAFEAAMKRHGLSPCEAPPALGCAPSLLEQASGGWREETGSGGLAIADRGRLFDLIVLGRSGRVTHDVHSDAIEEALLITGRPVLVAPVDPPKSMGEIIALAWNDSPESAKALAAAMPFLLQARDVRLLAVGESAAAALARHLAWHGIHAEAEFIYPVSGVSAGELLLAAAHEHGADLLVMGGYGRAPWREMVFGGTTRHVIGTSLLPLLLSH
jgi:nucleotide-binding universal stress UspA family protein